MYVYMCIYLMVSSGFYFPYDKKFFKYEKDSFMIMMMLMTIIWHKENCESENRESL